MVVEVQKHVCDGYLLKWFIAAGLAWLEHNRERVNRLNVFPVPDGDTGTNMCLTLQKAYEAIASVDEHHVGVVSGYIAQGALRGGRGNSGVILSQLLGGFARAIREHDVFDARLLANAYQKGVDAAYRAVIKPVEGTILTVARESSESLSRYVEKHTDLVGALDALLNAAKQALRKTPDILPILKEAGVVDSGGQGLVYILEGMARALHGETVYMSDQSVFPYPVALSNFDAFPEVDLSPDDEDGYGFDVQFLMYGQNLDVDKVRRDIDAMGWSTLVVGDEALIKVHVHVHDPGEPLSYAVKTGARIDDIVVENLQAQYETYATSRSQTAADRSSIAVIAVAAGNGIHRLFKDDLGAGYVIPGGQTMNPSTDDFLRAIESVSQQKIILLPNNKNVVLAARQAVQQAAELMPDRVIRVVPTTTIPQGIGAMVAYGDVKHSDTLDQVAGAMQDAVRGIVTGEVTRAVRESRLNGLTIQAGQFIGVLDGALLTAGDHAETVLQALLEKAIDEPHELVTLYYGKEISKAEVDQLVETLGERFPEMVFEVVYGGQPLYPYLLGVE